MPDAALKPQSAGQALAAEREARNLGHREVAEVLNLPIETLEALEAEDVERLPSAVFARGYVRAYAKLLELDADAIVASSPYAIDSSEPQFIDTSEHTPLVMASRAIWKKGAIPVTAATAAVLIGIFAVFVWLLVTLFTASPDTEEIDLSLTQSQMDAGVPSNTPDSADGAAPDTTAEEQAVPNGGMPRTSVEADAMDAAQLTVPEVDDTAVQVPDGISIDVPAEVVASQAGQSASPTAESDSGEMRRLTPAGEDRLELTFTDDCWVDIKHADGRSLYADLGKAGRTLQFVGQGPFRILLGYAPGVSMRFNYEAVALSPHTRNNVASLVIGQ